MGGRVACSETSAALQWRDINHCNILPISPLPLADVSLVLTLKAEVAPKQVFEAELASSSELLGIYKLELLVSSLGV